MKPDQACQGTIEPLLEILDGKWTLPLLRDLFNDVKRFGELRRSLHPISPKTLTDRLRMLEEKGIVTRTLYPGVPLHVEYELTDSGRRLQPIFAAMSEWARAEAPCGRAEPEAEAPLGAAASE